MKKSLFLKKTIAFFILLTVSTQAVETHLYASTAPASTSPTYKGNQRFSLSHEIGKVEEMFEGSSGKKIIYIQDAHDSLEAQENIARTIDILVAKHGVKTVFEEGYEGVVPTDEYFGGIQDKAVKAKVSHYFLDKLRIGGAEYAHINRKQDFQLIGADNIKMHFENVSWYREAALYEKVTKEDLKELHHEVEQLVQARFPKDFKAWLKLKARSEAHEISLVDYLNRTMAGQGMKREKYPVLSLLLEAGKSESPALLEQARHIDGKTLFEEIDRFENDYASGFLTLETDRKIFQYYKAINLLKRLSDIEMTSSEYATVKAYLESFSTQNLAEFLTQQTKKSMILPRQWESSIRHAVRFYELAKLRDEAVREKIEKWAQTSGENTAAIVFGGFHKEQIRQYFKELGISYVIVSPQMQSQDPFHKATYRDLMLRDYSRFEIPALVKQAATPPRGFELALAGGPAARAELLAQIQQVESAVLKMGDLQAEENLREAIDHVLSTNRKPVRSEVRAGKVYPSPLIFDEETLEAISKLPADTPKEWISTTGFNKIYKIEVKVGNKKIPLLLKRPVESPEAEKQTKIDLLWLNEKNIMEDIWAHPDFSKEGGRLYLTRRGNIRWQHPSLRLGVWNENLRGLIFPYIPAFHDRGKSAEDVSPDAYSVYIEHNMPLSPKLYFNLALQMAGALGYFHYLGFIHHDIKPGNFLMADHQVFLSDFNLAFNPRSKRPVMPGGTPIFAPRHQWNPGNEPSLKDDVYSLGMTLLRIWLGSQRSYQATELYFSQFINLSGEQILERIDFRGNPLEQVIRKAMGKNPYADAIEMEQAVRAAEAKYKTSSAGKTPAETTSAVSEDDFISAGQWDIERYPEIVKLRRTAIEMPEPLTIPEQWDNEQGAASWIRTIDPELKLIRPLRKSFSGVVYLVEKEGTPDLFELKIPVGLGYWESGGLQNSDTRKNILTDGALRIFRNDILFGHQAEPTGHVPAMKTIYDIRLKDWKGELFQSNAFLTRHIEGDSLENYLRKSPDEGQREFAKQFTRIVLLLRKGKLTLPGLNEGDKVALDAGNFVMETPVAGAEGESAVKLWLVDRGEIMPSEARSRINLKNAEGILSALEEAIRKIIATIPNTQPVPDAIRDGIKDGLASFDALSTTGQDLNLAVKSEVRLGIENTDYFSMKMGSEEVPLDQELREKDSLTLEVRSESRKNTADLNQAFNRSEVRSESGRSPGTETMIILEDDEKIYQAAFEENLKRNLNLDWQNIGNKKISAKIGLSRLIWLSDKSNIVTISPKWIEYLKHPFLILLWTVALTPFLPKIGSFGRFSYQEIKMGDEHALYISEIQPSRGFRHLSKGLQKHYTEWRRALLERMILEAYQTGYRRVYTASNESIRLFYVKKEGLFGLTDGSIVRNYILPFRGWWAKAWKKATVFFPYFIPEYLNSHEIVLRELNLDENFVTELKAKSLLLGQTPPQKSEVRSGRPSVTDFTKRVEERIPAYGIKWLLQNGKYVWGKNGLQVVHPNNNQNELGVSWAECGLSAKIIASLGMPGFIAGMAIPGKMYQARESGLYEAPWTTHHAVFVSDDSVVYDPTPLRNLLHNNQETGIPMEQHPLEEDIFRSILQSNANRVLVTSGPLAPADNYYFYSYQGAGGGGPLEIVSINSKQYIETMMGIGVVSASQKRSERPIFMFQYATTHHVFDPGKLKDGKIMYEVPQSLIWNFYIYPDKLFGWRFQAKMAELLKRNNPKEIRDFLINQADMQGYLRSNYISKTPGFSDQMKLVDAKIEEHFPLMLHFMASLPKISERELVQKKALAEGRRSEIRTNTGAVLPREILSPRSEVRGLSDGNNEKKKRDSSKSHSYPGFFVRNIFKFLIWFSGLPLLERYFEIRPWELELYKKMELVEERSDSGTSRHEHESVFLKRYKRFFADYVHQKYLDENNKTRLENGAGRLVAFETGNLIARVAESAHLMAILFPLVLTWSPNNISAYLVINGINFVMQMWFIMVDSRSTRAALHQRYHAINNGEHDHKDSRSEVRTGDEETEAPKKKYVRFPKVNEADTFRYEVFPGQTISTTDKKLFELLPFIQRNEEIPAGQEFISTRTGGSHGEIHLATLHKEKEKAALSYIGASHAEGLPIKPFIRKTGEREYSVGLSVKSLITSQYYPVTSYIFAKDGKILDGTPLPSNLQVSGKITAADIPFTTFPVVKEIIHGLTKGELPPQLRRLTLEDLTKAGLKGLFVKGRIDFWKDSVRLNTLRDFENTFLTLDPAPWLLPKNAQAPAPWVATLWIPAEGKRPEIPIDSIVLFSEVKFKSAEGTNISAGITRKRPFIAGRRGFEKVTGEIPEGKRAAGDVFKALWNIYWLAGGTDQVPEDDQIQVSHGNDPYLYRFNEKTVTIKLGPEFSKDQTTRSWVSFPGISGDARGIVYHNLQDGKIVRSQYFLLFKNGRFQMPELLAPDPSIFKTKVDLLSDELEKNITWMQSSAKQAGRLFFEQADRILGIIEKKENKEILPAGLAEAVTEAVSEGIKVFSAAKKHIDVSEESKLNVLTVRIAEILQDLEQAAKAAEPSEPRSEVRGIKESVRFAEDIRQAINKKTLTASGVTYQLFSEKLGGTHGFLLAPYDPSGIGPVSTLDFPRNFIPLDAPDQEGVISPIDKSLDRTLFLEWGMVLNPGIQRNEILTQYIRRILVPTVAERTPAGHTVVLMARISHLPTLIQMAKSLPAAWQEKIADILAKWGSNGDGFIEPGQPYIDEPEFGIRLNSISEYPQRLQKTIVMQRRIENQLMDFLAAGDSLASKQEKEAVVAAGRVAPLFRPFMGLAKDKETSIQTEWVGTRKFLVWKWTRPSSRSEARSSAPLKTPHDGVDEDKFIKSMGSPYVVAGTSKLEIRFQLETETALPKFLNLVKRKWAESRDPKLVNAKITRIKLLDGPELRKIDGHYDLNQRLRAKRMYQMELDPDLHNFLVTNHDMEKNSVLSELIRIFQTGLTGPPGARTLLELGPGRGFMTKKILDHGLFRLIHTIEKNPETVEYLRLLDPSILVHEKDFFKGLPALFQGPGIQKADAVLASHSLYAHMVEDRIQVMTDAVQMLKPEGKTMFVIVRNDPSLENGGSRAAIRELLTGKPTWDGADDYWEMAHYLRALGFETEVKQIAVPYESSNPGDVFFTALSWVPESLRNDGEILRKLWEVVRAESPAGFKVPGQYRYRVVNNQQIIVATREKVPDAARIAETRAFQALPHEQVVLRLEKRDAKFAVISVLDHTKKSPTTAVRVDLPDDYSLTDNRDDKLLGRIVYSRNKILHFKIKSKTTGVVVEVHVLRTKNEKFHILYNSNEPVWSSPARPLISGGRLEMLDGEIIPGTEIPADFGFSKYTLREISSPRFPKVAWRIAGGSKDGVFRPVHRSEVRAVPPVTSLENLLKVPGLEAIYGGKTINSFIERNSSTKISRPRLTKEEISKIAEIRRTMQSAWQTVKPKTSDGGIYGPFVRASQQRLARALQFLNVKPDEAIFDAGFGDGAAILTMASLFGLKAEGAEHNPFLFRKGIAAQRALERKDLLNVDYTLLHNESLLDIAWNKFQYVYYYSFGSTVPAEKIEEKLARELPVGGKFLLLGFTGSGEKDTHYENFSGLLKSGIFSLERVPGLGLWVFTKTRESRSLAASSAKSEVRGGNNWRTYVRWGVRLSVWSLVGAAGYGVYRVIKGGQDLDEAEQLIYWAKVMLLALPVAGVAAGAAILWSHTSHFNWRRDGESKLGADREKIRGLYEVADAKKKKREAHKKAKEDAKRDFKSKRKNVTQGAGVSMEKIQSGDVPEVRYRIYLPQSEDEIVIVAANAKAFVQKFNQYHDQKTFKLTAAEGNEMWIPFVVSGTPVKVNIFNEKTPAILKLALDEAESLRSEVRSNNGNIQSSFEVFGGLGLLDYRVRYWEKRFETEPYPADAILQRIYQDPKFQGHYQNPKNSQKSFEPFLPEKDIQQLAQVIVDAGLSFIFEDGLTYARVYHPDLHFGAPLISFQSLYIEDEINKQIRLRSEILLADIPLDTERRDRFLQIMNRDLYPDWEFKFSKGDTFNIKDYLEDVLRKAEEEQWTEQSKKNIRLALGNLLESLEAVKKRNNLGPSLESAQQLQRTLFFHEIGELIFNVLPAGYQQEWRRLLDDTSSEFSAKPGIILFKNTAKQIFQKIIMRTGGDIDEEEFADYFAMVIYPENIYSKYGEVLPVGLERFIKDKVLPYLKNKHKAGQNIWSFTPEKEMTVIIEPNEISESFSENMARRGEVRVVDDQKRKLLNLSEIIQKAGPTKFFVDASAKLSRPFDTAAELVRLKRAGAEVVLYNIRAGESDSELLKILNTFPQTMFKRRFSSLPEALQPEKFRTNINLVHYSEGEISNKSEVETLLPGISAGIIYIAGKPGSGAYALNQLAAIKLTGDQLKQQLQDIGIEKRSGYLWVSEEKAGSMMTALSLQTYIAFAQAA